MEIIINTGKMDMMMRGGDGSIELCQLKAIKDRDTGEINNEWVAQKYYSSVEQCLNSVANMRIRNCDATTLSGLLQCVQNIRTDIKQGYGALIK